MGGGSTVQTSPMTVAIGVLLVLLVAWLEYRVSSLETQIQTLHATSGSQAAISSLQNSNSAVASPAVEKRLTELDSKLFALYQKMKFIGEKGSAASPSQATAAPVDLGEMVLPTTKENDEFNVRSPTKMSVKNGDIVLTPLNIAERLRYLELKTNGYMNWGNYIDLDGHVTNGLCKKSSKLSEYDEKCNGGSVGALTQGKMDEKCPGLYDHTICLDSFPPPQPNPNGRKCVVYDFGIREQPQFGQVLANKPFDCEVHAFDPSPISTEYAKSHLQGNPNYIFHPYGAGGRDGDIELFKYNWGQVSSLRFPMYTNKWECLNPDIKKCNAQNPAEDLQIFHLPVKTLPTIMKELGHTHIDVIKIDVEGSEYVLMEQMFDTFGCPPATQITLEWHHFSFDPRYGAGSSPNNNALVTMLHRCGFKQMHHHLIGGWPSDDPVFMKIGMEDVRYNIASFIKVED